MKKSKEKIIVSMLCFSLLSPLVLISSATPVTFNEDNQTRGYISWDPESYQFPNKPEDIIDQTTFQIWYPPSCGGTAVRFEENADWVNVYPKSTIATCVKQNIEVTIDTTDLPAGFYSCDIKIIWSTGDGVFRVSVRVTNHSTPTLVFNPKTHDFGSVEPEDIYTTTFEIFNLGLGSLIYSISDTDSWVNVTPTEGTSNGENDTIEVQISTLALSEGNYTSNIVIESNGGSGVFTLSVQVGERSHLTVAVRGGFVIHMTISNVDAFDAHDLDWNLTITGGIVLTPREFTGAINQLSAGQSTTERIPLIGFGPIQIEARVKKTVCYESKLLVFFLVI